MACTQAQIQIGLSATFLSKDSFVLHIQKTMFPKEFRYDKVKMPKYIKLYSIAYSFDNMREAKIKTTSWGSNTYSHVEYEKSILKRKRSCENYLEVVASISNMLCEDQLEEGDKYLIFASMKEMCIAIKEKLTPIYKDLKVSTYLSGDPRSNIDSDIIISTLGSAGTALDIPNLRRVLMTTSVDSPVANKQALGRLRDLSSKGKDVKFAYIYCEQLSKQKQYHHAKQKLFAESVVYHKDLYYSLKL
jgi:superfamily II DNA or RNA helicase